MNQIENINQRWRAILIRHFYLAILIVFTLEVYVFITLYQSNDLSYSVGWFLIRFMIAPTVFNVIILGIANIANRSEKLSNASKNYAVAIAYFLLCACVQMTHYRYQPVLCAPIVALFITSILGDVKINRLIAVLSYISTICTYFIASIEQNGSVEGLFEDTLIAFVIIFCSVLLSGVFIRKEEEREHLLVNSYESHSNMLYELQHDYLTGLYNRKTFFDTLEYLISSNKRVCLAIIDLDDFKLINDTYGHPAGDQVLHYSAKHMQKRSSGSIFVSRIGGEEFAIIFVEMNLNEVGEELEKMRISVEKHIFRASAGGKKINVTLSAGFAAHSKGESIQDLYEKADTALYQAKGNGKNQVVKANG